MSAAFQASDGQEPWLVVWKKGVDGQVLWNTLCPTMTTGDQSPAALSGRSSDDNLDSRDASRSLKAKMPRELVLNCSVRFSHLFSGFACTALAHGMGPQDCLNNNLPHTCITLQKCLSVCLGGNVLRQTCALDCRCRRPPHPQGAGCNQGPVQTQH